MKPQVRPIVVAGFLLPRVVGERALARMRWSS